MATGRTKSELEQENAELREEIQELNDALDAAVAAVPRESRFRYDVGFVIC